MTDTSRGRERVGEGVLARRVAHAIRTPLGVVSVALARLKESARDDAETQMLELGGRAVRQLGRLADRLGLLARLEREPDMTRSQCDLAVIVRDAAGDIAQTRSRRRVQVGLEGVASEHVTLEGDPALLRAAVAELIDNGVRMAERRVDVALARRDANLVVTVANDGPPVPEGASLEPDGSGLGIGLAIVETIVRRHQGRLEWKSMATPDGTTTEFSLCVPATVAI